MANCHLLRAIIQPTVAQLILFMHDYKISVHSVWTAKSIVASSFVDQNGLHMTLRSHTMEAPGSSRAIGTEPDTSRCYFVKPTGQSTSQHASNGHCDACRSHVLCLGRLLNSPHFKQVFTGFSTEHNDLVISITNQEQTLETNEVITGLITRLRAIEAPIPTQPAPIPTDPSLTSRLRLRIEHLGIELRQRFHRRQPSGVRP
jgi:hypothetical protein